MTLQSELLVAAAGIVDPKLTESSIAQSDKLLFDIERKLRQWVKSADSSKWTPPKTLNARRVQDEFLATLDAFPGMELLFDELDQILTLQGIQKARQMLLDQFPLAPILGYGAPLEPPLSPDEIQDWSSLIAVANDPMRLVLEITSCAVYEDLFEIADELYPEIMKLIREVVTEEVSLLKGQLDEKKEFSCKLLLGEGEPQLIETPKAEGEEQPTPEPRKSVTDSLTVAQRVGVG